MKSISTPQTMYLRVVNSLLYLVPSLVLLSGILYLCQQIHYVTFGNFIYSLDDPYIHLSLAEEISHGFYGINLSEPAAPSSSILWPFLLAPFADTDWFEFVPLVLNSILSLITILILIRFVSSLLCDLPPIYKVAGTITITCAFIPATNLIGVIFTGMEHSLQILLTVLILIGMYKLIIFNSVPIWFMAALLIAPLVRYECLAFVIPAMIMLPYKRHWRKAFIVAVLLALGIGGFSYYLRSIGLGWLPSSVIAKTKYISADSQNEMTIWASGLPLIELLLKNFIEHILTPQGRITVLYLLILTLRAIIPLRNYSFDKADRTLAGLVSLGLLAHLLLARSGWWGRYELYAFISGLLTLVYITRHHIKTSLLKLPFIACPIIFILITSFGLHYLDIFLRTPDAARDIYEQQYQMHRFISKWYDGPVAVNDLGWVSYRNQNYVLDLWGLASYEALGQRTSIENPEWMSVLAEKHNIKLAMIYEEWFPTLPKSWTPVARMHLSGKTTTAGGDTVTFFALTPTVVDDIRTDLEEFQTTLPEGVKLDILQ